MRIDNNKFIFRFLFVVINQFCYLTIKFFFIVALHRLTHKCLSKWWSLPPSLQQRRGWVAVLGLLKESVGSRCFQTSILFGFHLSNYFPLVQPLLQSKLQFSLSFTQFDDFKSVFFWFRATIRHFEWDLCVRDQHLYAANIGDKS